MSFVAESRQRSPAVLPLASFVDILFLLLTFFLTTSALRERELQIPVDLAPSRSTEEAGNPALQATVTIDETGRIFLAATEHTIDSLRQRLSDLVAVDPNQMLVVRADRASQSGTLIQVIDAAQEAGVGDVRVATEKSLEEIR